MAVFSLLPRSYRPGKLLRLKPIAKEWRRLVKRVAEKSQAEEQGEKKEKLWMFVGLILGLCLSIAFCELQAETMRFAIKFEPSAVQFSWYELECQLREILARPVQQGLEEGTLA
ncbi:hypothetical protein PAPYR_9940 [Paratrimastix pyriformis]|uniref:Uncharacterized protein n=1 Tax=Paratrimastix pyriformis TaxID=342808 RepID=A0ABQ8UBY8_9EUKA|nr:hypothetical protein PAPYR_9940 [Paratrimastix pyriformis]